jgi:hypothetical protein
MSAADRYRRYRERRRADKLCVRIELGHDVIDALIEAGRIGAWDENDRDAIAKAVERLCEESAATRGGEGEDTPAIVRDDDLLVQELAKLIGSADAREVWATLEDYRTNRWRQDRLAAVCPHAVGTVEAICWQVLKRNSQPLSVEKLEEALWSKF